jgi:isoleucyl-tRNA synthetase
MLAPILVFTSDEIWENLPRSGDKWSESVHLTELPSADGERELAMRDRWEQLFKVREQVLRALEEARNAKIIGSSLEARVELEASGRTLELLERYSDQLRYIFIVSEVALSKNEAASGIDALSVTVAPAEGKKCERCWNYSKHVGESDRYPTACERCVAALAEIEAEGQNI